MAVPLMPAILQSTSTTDRSPPPCTNLAGPEAAGAAVLLPAAATGAGAEVPAPKRKPASRSTSCSPSKKPFSPTGGQLKTSGPSQAVDGSAAGVAAASVAAAEATTAAEEGVEAPCGECSWAGCAWLLVPTLLLLRCV
jgi:hypothetical protein